MHTCRAKSMEIIVRMKILISGDYVERHLSPVLLESSDG